MTFTIPMWVIWTGGTIGALAIGIPLIMLAVIGWMVVRSLGK